MTESIRVDKALYRSALLDAIDYTESFLGGHEPDFRGGPSCCKPGARCDGYKQAAALLARYRKALDAVGGPPPEPEGKPVLVSELMARWRAEAESTPSQNRSEPR
jgi:hypothetical protein